MPMTNRSSVLPALISVSLLLALILHPAAATAAGSIAGPVQLIVSDARGISIEVTAPPFELQAARDVSAAGAEAIGERGSTAVETCQTVALEGYVQSADAGKPQLPVKVVLLGVPPNAKLSLNVQPLSSRVVASGVSVCPAVTRRVEQEPNGIVTATTYASLRDPAVYSEERFYPAQNATLVDLGFMRGQRIVRLEVYPFQHNPVTGELRFSDKIRVAVEFGDAAAGLALAQPAGPVEEPAAFESSFRDLLLNYDEAKAWRATTAPVQPATAGWTPPNPGYKVAVQQDGIYKLTYAQLETAGLPVTTLDPRTLKLFNAGQQVKISVTGEGDGRLDSGDVVIFYGLGANTRYTGTNAYWLTYGGAAGLRMASKASQGGGAQADSFLASSRLEQNLAYVSSLPKLSGFDHWYGKLWTATGPSKSFTENLTVSKMAATAPAATAELEVRLGGNMDRRHHVRLYVNGQQVLDNSTTWIGRTVYSATVSFPHSYVVEGPNQVKVELVNDVPGFAVDQVYADWLRLGYQRTYSADGDVLAFGGDAAGSWQYRVTGFSGSSVDAYDITDPAGPAVIAGTAVTGAGPYTLGFGDNASDPRRYIALATAARLSPLSIALDTPSSLQGGPGADYIIITHGDFRSAIQPLADRRAAQGLRVRVVDVQDVYDEFGYGLMSAEAIRDFIAYAYGSTNWSRPAPAYVLLVGDGTYDLRRYLATSGPTYLPPYLENVDPDLGETAADNRFVAVNGSDIMPDLNIGRLPANTAAETTAMVDKILAYETVTPSQAWTRQVLLVADDLEDGGGNFYALSDAIADGYSLYKGQLRRNLPAPYVAKKIYLGQTCDTDNVGNTNPSVECRQQIIDSLNTPGAFMVSYIGHGTKTVWASEHLFDAAALSQLHTGGHLPIMLPMTCNEGFFHEPQVGVESLSEAEIRAPNNGAVASWAPTGFGLSTGHDYLERGLLLSMFYDRVQELGAATTAAKLYLAANAAPGAFEDLIDTFLLLGDPALRVPLQPPPLSRTFIPLIRK